MIEPLGTVIAPSGALIIVDCGYLGMWSHRDEPVMPDGILDSDEVLALARSAVDLRLVGPGADEVGRALDRQWHPSYLFDIPRAHVADLERQVAELAAARGVAAAIEILPERIPHRRRCDLALAHGAGAGEVSFHGARAVIVAGVPPGPHAVEGERMPAGGTDEGRLRRVIIRFSDEPVVRVESVGHVGVDWARLMAADVDALGAWSHDAPLDGLADVVFWGRDAEELAAAVGAGPVAEGFGWLDIPVVDAADRYEQVMALRDERGCKVAIDARPHSHHYLLMAQIRAEATESGVVDVGGATFCGFATRWGDGIYEVFRDLGADGRAVQVRVELGTPERVELMKKLFERSKAALVSRLILDGGEPVRFLYREAPDVAQDSGWRMFSGVEPQDDDDDSVAVVPLSTLVRMDRRLDALVDEPVGSVFECVPGAEEFVRVTDWSPSDDSSD